jgi:hypothetical protein
MDTGRRRHGQRHLPADGRRRHSCFAPYAGLCGRVSAGDPLPEPDIVARAGASKAAQDVTRLARVHLRAGCGEPDKRLVLAGCELIRPGEQDPGGPAG